MKGNRADLVLIDDPLPGSPETSADAVWAWYNNPEVRGELERGAFAASLPGRVEFPRRFLLPLTAPSVETFARWWLSAMIARMRRTR